MTFEEYWATTGPWPDNILGTAFKEVAQKAWEAGQAEVEGCIHSDCDQCDTGYVDSHLYECDACSAKPGAPELCSTCIQNRAASGDRWHGPRYKIVIR